MTKQEKLFKYCKEYIRDLDINCSETVYQTDRVSESSLEFIEGIALIVGFAKPKENHEND